MRALRMHTIPHFAKCSSPPNPRIRGMLCLVGFSPVLGSIRDLAKLAVVNQKLTEYLSVQWSPLSGHKGCSMSY